MHTSSVTYHRLVFSDVQDRARLHELVATLDLQWTEHPDVFDLVQDEGRSLVTKEAIEVLGEAYGLDPEFDQVNGSSPDFKHILKTLREKAAACKYIPHTRVFEDSYHSEAVEFDIGTAEVFDLITVLAGSNFTLDNITTQWAVFSNKNVAGAHHGGSRIVTRHFDIPVSIHCDEMETVTNTLRRLTPAQAGDYYVNKFITPLIDEAAIKDPVFHMSVIIALLRTVLPPRTSHDHDR